MNRKLAYLAALATLIAGMQSNSVMAQERKVPDTPPDMQWTEVYDKMFVERTPLIGEFAPSAKAFDEHGEKFKMSSLEGKYTVIVFGCLT